MIYNLPDFPIVALSLRKMPRKTTLAVFIIALFALLFIIRFIHLTADPPYDLSTSGGPYGDPAGYSFNARNKILFGEWEVDDFNMMYVSFPPHLVTYLFFKIFGAGIGAQNLVPILFSFFTLILFFMLLRNQAGDTIALIGTGLLGINYLFLMYSKIANRIMPALFFILLGIFFLHKGKKRPFWQVFAGVSFFLALISKSVIFYAVGAVLVGYLAYLLFNNALKDILKRAVLIIVGSLIPFLPWLFFIYIPQKGFINSFSQLNVQYLIPPRNLSLVLRYFWTRPLLLIEKMPLISFLAAIFSLLLLFKVIHKPKATSLLEWVFLAWFFTGFLYYSVIQQRVTRHYIPHIIPMVFLAALLASRLLSKSKRSPPQKPRLLFGILALFWIIFPASLILKAAAAEFPNLFPDQTVLNLVLVFLSVTMAAALFFFLRIRSKSQNDRISIPLRRALIISLFLASSVFQLSDYTGWAFHAPYQFKEASQDFGKAFDTATIAGLWAPAISLENNHRAHEYFQGYINDREDFFEHFGVTHIFTTTAFGENLIFERNFPRVMETAKLLARYHIWTVEALLYDISCDSQEPEDGVFESELFTQRGSTPRFDPGASQKFAVLNRDRKSGFVVLIPSEDALSEGKHKITFRMKKQGDGEDLNKRIARIDVITRERPRVLAFKDVFPMELSKKKYHDFNLTISLKRPKQVMMRIYSQGNGFFWADCVRIVKIE
jgi:4-amino-4-deoxy-L-arabinose transferase-like glycosyltransferase